MSWSTARHLKGKDVTGESDNLWVTLSSHLSGTLSDFFVSVFISLSTNSVQDSEKGELMMDLKVLKATPVAG